MTTRQAAFVFLFSAIALANAPFVIEQWLLLPFSRRQVKPGAVRLLEWLLLYFLWMAIGYLLESNAGKVAIKDWQIWSISAVFFAVLTFPGVTRCYLWRK